MRPLPTLSTTRTLVVSALAYLFSLTIHVLGRAALLVKEDYHKKAECKALLQFGQLRISKLKWKLDRGEGSWIAILRWLSPQGLAGIPLLELPLEV